MGTPPKTNMEPENTPLEKEKHLLKHQFLGFHVSFRGCKYISPMDPSWPAGNCTMHWVIDKSDVRHAGDVAHEMALVVGGSQFFASWKQMEKRAPGCLC